MIRRVSPLASGWAVAPGPLGLACLLAVLLAILLAAVAPAGAQMLCSKPLQPLCSTDVQQFADEAERQRCLEDTERYLGELRAYRDCLAEAIEGAEQSLARGETFRSCVQDGGEDCRLDSESNL